MRKILNLVLVFVMSLAVVGIGFNAVKAEATTDVTITLHIHQYDGDYTDSGTGIWDGVTWNNWGDVVSSTDTFGGVIVKTYTAAEINAVGDSMEFKPTKDVNVEAKGDITQLIDAFKTMVANLQKLISNIKANATTTASSCM